jgi:hypothetical protein
MRSLAARAVLILRCASAASSGPSARRRVRAEQASLQKLWRALAVRAVLCGADALQQRSNISLMHRGVSRVCPGALTLLGTTKSRS